jgi:hypothetical protein
LKKDSTIYTLDENADEVNNIILDEIKRKSLNNINGEYSINGGINISNRLVFYSLSPNTGPLVKINFSAVNINQNGTKSKLTLKRQNGKTYFLHFYFILFFIVLTCGIAIYQISKSNLTESFSYLIMPVFGVFYLLIIEFISVISAERIIKKIEIIIRKNEITLNRQ